MIALKLATVGMGLDLKLWEYVLAQTHLTWILFVVKVVGMLPQV